MSSLNLPWPCFESSIPMRSALPSPCPLLRKLQRGMRLSLSLLLSKADKPRALSLLPGHTPQPQPQRGPPLPDTLKPLPPISDPGALWVRLPRAEHSQAMPSPVSVSPGCHLPPWPWLLLSCCPQHPQTLPEAAPQPLLSQFTLVLSLAPPWVQNPALGLSNSVPLALPRVASVQIPLQGLSSLQRVHSTPSLVSPANLVMLHSTLASRSLIKALSSTSCLGMSPEKQPWPLVRGLL